MKKLFAALLCVILTLSLAACGATRTVNLLDPNDTADVSTPSVDSQPAGNNTPADGEIVLDAGKFDITVPSDYHVANEYIPAGSEITVMITDKLSNIALSFVEEPFSDFEGTGIVTADDYLELQHDNSKGNVTSQIQEKDGVKYFTYTYLNTDLGYTYKYYTTVRTSGDSFWALQGFCLESQYDSLEEDFARWLNSVTFH